LSDEPSFPEEPPLHSLLFATLTGVQRSKVPSTSSDLRLAHTQRERFDESHMTRRRRRRRRRRTNKQKINLKSEELKNGKEYPIKRSKGALKYVYDTS
jgi:hypothetical protein